jgi:phospho-N-acetylmuramoyl-pentapeptide-transferase
VKIILLSAAVSMAVSLLGTPVAIRLFTKRGLGQEIREEGPAGHASKRGTPTMGGTVIIVASLIGYLVGHVFNPSDPMTASGLLVLFLMTGLGLVGFADDFIKLYMRRSLGLRSGAKVAGQVLVGIIFAVLALHFPDGLDITPASMHLSFLTDFGISIGPVFFVVWVIFMVAGMSNGVNLTDGLDGLATGASILVLAAYVIIGNWQLRNDCTALMAPNCYDVRDPLDLSVVAAVVLGACFGFLWWNAPPAKIFMGDTGSLALGGVLAGLAITTKTELLLPILGGLFVVITMSDVIQIGVFKVTRMRTGKGYRVFRMAPLQHHFEMVGWAETTIVIRFWLIAGIFVAGGLGIFYVGWFPKLPCLARPGVGSQRRVQGRGGEPVGQCAQRVGANAEDDLQCVLRGVAVAEERLQGIVAHVARGLENPQREQPDRFEALVGEGCGRAQGGDQVRVRAHRGEPLGVDGDAQMAAVPGGHRHDEDLPRQRFQRGALEDRVHLEEAVKHVWRGCHPGGTGGQVTPVVTDSGQRAPRRGRCGLSGVIGERHGRTLSAILDNRVVYNSK